MTRSELYMAKKPFPFSVCEQCCTGDGGGENGSEGTAPFVVIFAKADDGTITADQTFDAIETAYEERKPILGFLTYTETSNMGGGATASITFNEQYYYVGGRTFTSLQIDKFRQIICNVWTDEWSLTVDAPIVKSSIVTQIDADSDDKHYPTAKAVVGFVDNQIGNIETALDNIIAIQNELMGGDAV